MIRPVASVLTDENTRFQMARFDTDEGQALRVQRAEFSRR